MCTLIHRNVKSRYYEYVKINEISIISNSFFHFKSYLFPSEQKFGFYLKPIMTV